MTCELWRSRLDAYVDESCLPDERDAFEDHLQTCQLCSVEALGRLQMKRAVRSAAARYTPSQEFRLRLEGSIKSQQRPRWAFGLFPWATAFAAALLLVVLPSALWIRHSSREQALAQLVDLHVATLASTNPVDVVSTDRHTVKPWFQGKLPFTFNLPELANSQYNLIGGRLVYLDHRPAAQLLYQLHKHELSVFIMQGSDGAPAPADARENGFSIESWARDALRYIVVSDAAPADVHALGDRFRATPGM
jgi:anti-sigma factor RsiW